MTLEFRILGPLEVRLDGAPVPIGGPRQRALLALLLTRANATVARSRLIDELWGEAPPASAVNVLQTYVSHLRRELPAGRLVTRPPGYSLLVEPGELDLHRFEELVGEGREARAEGDAARAAEALAAALALWRGPALGDVVDAALGGEAARLEELRLAALEDRVDALLELGRHRELVPELEALVAEHALRERLRALLMLALYRSGRQADALVAYRQAREALVEELGIEPGHELRELHTAILNQDPALDRDGAGPTGAPARSLLVASLGGARLPTAVGIAEPLARHPLHGLVLVRLVTEPAGLAAGTRLVNAARARLEERGVGTRAAAFTSADAAVDVARLAGGPEVALLLVEGAAPPGADGRLDPTAAAVLADVPCDVGLLFGGDGGDSADGAGAPVVVPFGGSHHEWAAAELGTWIAAAERRPLLLVGVEADEAAGRRDASRLLAKVALLVQQVAGVHTEPALVAPGAAGVLELAVAARVLVVGVPEDWRAAGLGTTRAELVRRSEAPALLVRGGLRPGGLAPAESVTRFTWTLEGRAG